MGGGRLRTWRFDCILPIKREEKSNIQGLYHLKFLISFSYRIYSINRPGRLLHFWTLGVGAYSRLGAYQILTIFSKWSMCILQQNNKC